MVRATFFLLIKLHCTDVPTTGVPTTGLPSTDVPTITDVPTTDVPTTDLPTTVELKYSLTPSTTKVNITSYIRTYRGTDLVTMGNWYCYGGSMGKATCETGNSGNGLEHILKIQSMTQVTCRAR